jgi:hypothetical protein
MEGLFLTMGKAHSSLTSNQRMLASVKVSLFPRPMFKNKFSTPKQALDFFNLILPEVMAKCPLNQA